MLENILAASFKMEAACLEKRLTSFSADTLHLGTAAACHLLRNLPKVDAPANEVLTIHY
jgi:hypothetical protein